MLLACADLYCLSKARASIESGDLCTFLEALGYLKAVAETPKSVLPNATESEEVHQVPNPKEAV